MSVLVNTFNFRQNVTQDNKVSITWFTHQNCEDMFLMSKWNQTKIYDYAIERDFGTDYGICCWYTPQLNFTEIDIHTRENQLSMPDWGHWFMNVPKVSLSKNASRHHLISSSGFKDWKS